MVLAICDTVVAHADGCHHCPIANNKRSPLIMVDTRLQRMARVLVNYSLGIKKGDRLAIMSGTQAAPLVREIVREAIHAGAYPETFVSLPSVQEILLKEGSDEQLSYIPAAQRLIFEEYEAMLQIFSQDN